MFGNIFDDHKEIDRLAVQNRLLKEYELPVYQRLMEGRTGLRVLDVGCNNGSKTADRFAHPSVEKIIGLEYNQDLVEEAQATYGDRWFSFFQCDVEQPDFAPKLRGWMGESQVEAFDLIHISLVLLHLAEPDKLLGILKNFLAPEGKILIVEINDAVSWLSPDPEGLFQEFLDILLQDPFSGDRNCGGKVPGILRKQGYSQIVLENETIGAEGGNSRKKEDLFDMFFSYLPEDVQLLLEKEPDNRQYAQWKKWMDRSYESLHDLVLDEGSVISLGLNIFTAMRGEAGPLRAQKLTGEYLGRVAELCGQCVGENLYPESYLASIMEKPGHFFDLFLTGEDEIAGYCYAYLTSLEEAAAAAKLPADVLATVSLVKNPVVANIQAVGTAPACRNQGLGRQMLERMLERLRETDAALAVCIAWKINGFVPLADNLTGCGFQYITDSHLVWYDHEDLVCPYCKGRCKCDAAVYYKMLERGGFD